MNPETSNQLFSLKIDLGQVIITILMGVIGYFIKTTIEDIKKKMASHENMFFQMNSDIQRIIGHLGVQGRTHFRKDDILED